MSYYQKFMKTFTGMKWVLLLTAGFFALSAMAPDNKPDPGDKAGTAKIVFKSTDGGQTWQDISKGLPENLRKDGIRGDSIFANDKGLFLRVGNNLYHCTANATAPFWTAAFFPDENSSIAPGKSGIFAYNYWGVNLRTTNETNI